MLAVGPPTLLEIYTKDSVLLPDVTKFLLLHIHWILLSVATHFAVFVSSDGSSPVCIVHVEHGMNLSIVQFVAVSWLSCPSPPLGYKLRSRSFQIAWQPRLSKASSRSLLKHRCVRKRKLREKTMKTYGDHNRERIAAKDVLGRRGKLRKATRWKIAQKPWPWMLGERAGIWERRGSKRIGKSMLTFHPEKTIYTFWLLQFYREGKREMEFLLKHWPTMASQDFVAMKVKLGV